MGRKAPEGDANTSRRQSDDSIEGAEPNRRHWRKQEPEALYFRLDHCAPWRPAFRRRPVSERGGDIRGALSDRNPEMAFRDDFL